jgi:hypothetical protein
VTITRVRKLANPRRHKRRNARKRVRKMTPRQIRYFGSKRQRAALKANRRRNGARRRRVAAPKAVRVRRRNTRRHRRRTNPALLVTLGPTVNPRKRRKNVAKTRRRNRRRNSVAHHHTRRRRRVRATANPVRRRYNRRRRNAVHHRRRRRNPTRVMYVTRRSNRRRRNRRNPSILGVNIASKSGIELIGGGLLGVAATKFLPTVLPSSVFSTLGSSTLATTAVSGISAFIAGWVASRFNPNLGAGVYFGGFMQTASVALNGFLPSIYSAIGSPLSGLGNFAPGRFAVPQNPLRGLPAASGVATPAPAGSVTVASPLSSAYGSAY